MREQGQEIAGRIVVGDKRKEGNEQVIFFDKEKGDKAMSVIDSLPREMESLCGFLLGKNYNGESNCEPAVGEMFFFPKKDVSAEHLT